MIISQFSLLVLYIEPSLKEKIAAGVTDNNFGLRGSVNANWL